MKWIFDNLQVIILVAGAIAYWLNQRRKVEEEQNEEQRRLAEPPQTSMHTPTGVDDEAERVRRIQEEIRRKILERVGGGAGRAQPPPMPAQDFEREEEAPLQQPTVLARTPTKADAYAQASSEDQTMSRDRVMLERQQQLAEQLRELDAQRRQTVSKAEEFAEKTEAVMAASNTPVRGSLLADLRNPAAARRAIVMREVLGTPVGLR